MDSETIQQLADIGLVVAVIALFYLLVYFVIFFIAKASGKIGGSSFARILHRELKEFPIVIWFSLTCVTVLQIPLFLQGFPFFKNILTILFAALLFFSLSRFVNKVINKYFRYKSKKAADPSKAHYYKYLAIITRTIVWSVGGLVILYLMGVDIDGFFAFLGLSSLGLSFALRNTIKDALNSFIIVFQKPFQVGDYIKSMEQYGQIISVNLKNTQLKTIDEKIVSIPNSQLMDKPVTNFLNRNNIKMIYDLSVVTPKLGRYERKMENIKKKLYQDSENIEDGTIEIISVSLSPEKHTYRVAFVLDLEDRHNLDVVNRNLMHLIFNTFKDQKLDVEEITLNQKIDPFAR